MTLDVADRLAIHEMFGLYGHLIDQRRWEDLDQVFTADAVFDATSFGQPVTHALADLAAQWSGDLSQHPLAHHVTNIVITEVDDRSARVESKAIGVGRKGRVGSATYHDLVVRTPDGWRLAHRVAELRRPDPSELPVPGHAVTADADFARRLDRLESQWAITQLPVRYALAVDGRDVDTWVSLFVPHVQVTRDESGRHALSVQIDGMLRTFGRSVHQICGHRVELDPDDDELAQGTVYCRAEHEVDDRWIVMAICYFDDYQRVDGEWLFVRRREKHWYAADINEHPQAVDFDSWGNGPAPALPGRFPTWESFWSGPPRGPGPLAP
jgi:hypothetical protein